MRINRFNTEIRIHHVNNLKMEEKTVLAHLGARVRPMKFSGTKTDLISAIKFNFSDVLSDDALFFIQVSRWMYGMTTRWSITATDFFCRLMIKIGVEYLLIYSLNKR